MISIKRYLTEYSKLSAEKGYPRILCLVLEGLARSAIEGDPSELEQFAGSISTLTESLREAGGVAEAFLIAEAALAALADYNQRTRVFLHQPRLELQNMIAMLTETITSMASGCETSVRRLQNVEQKIERARDIGDVQQLKGQLLECLEQVRAETEQQQKVRATTGQIQAELESSRQRMVSATKELDPITGLPAAAEANEALRLCLKQDRRFYAAAFVVQRIQSINMRFGYDLGDQVLKAFRDHLRLSLSESDRLFRYRGPTIIALIDRAQPVERVRVEMKRIGENSKGRTFEINGREVIIAINANWTVVPVEDSELSVRAQIDTFIASQLPAVGAAT